MMQHARAMFVLIVVGICACSRDERAADTVAFKLDTASPRSSAAEKKDTSSPPPSTPAKWVVTQRGIGTLEAGMTPAQAYAALGVSTTAPTAQAWKDCGYATFGALPKGVRVMVEEGTIARVEVHDSSTTTLEGAGVGDSEARIHSLYGSRVEVQPHKYTKGHYLVVRSAAPQDSMFRLVFETDGKKVLEYRAGRRPAVEYVERCG